jgi:hypothetical protein
MTGEKAHEAAPEKEPERTATVPLNEFCMSLSVHDKRVELIAGFHSDELRENRLHDLESAYRERYAAFADRPVK